MTSHQTRQRVYDFQRGTLATSGLVDGGANVTGTVTTDGTLDLVLAGSNEEAGYVSQANVGGFDIDDLLAFECVAQIKDNDAIVGGAAADLYLGLIGAGASANGISLATYSFFRIEGQASGNPKIYAEVNNASITAISEDTGLTMTPDVWYRFRMDFKEGIQSISVPGTSKGGKGAIQFTVTDERGWQAHPQLQSHMDMNDYTSYLQPYVSVFSANNPADGNVTLSIREICVDYRLH